MAVSWMRDRGSRLICSNSDPDSGVILNASTAFLSETVTTML